MSVEIATVQQAHPKSAKSVIEIRLPTTVQNVTNILKAFRIPMSVGIASGRTSLKMGTNFYLISPVQVTEKYSDGLVKSFVRRDRMHIGKSSGGLCFSLHVYPDQGINDLDDWIPSFNSSRHFIEDEYGDRVSSNEMLSQIKDRCWDLDGDHTVPVGYTSWQDFLDRNRAEPGPNGLLRHRIEERPDASERSSFSNGCVKHGSGTWDCIVGDFS